MRGGDLRGLKAGDKEIKTESYVGGRLWRKDCLLEGANSGYCPIGRGLGTADRELNILTPELLSRLESQMMKLRF